MKKPKGARVMVYDSTDVATSLKRLGASGSLPLGMDYSDINVPLGLSHSWFVGGRLYRLLGRIDHFAGFESWDLALDWLASVAPGRKLAQVQFWGHGSPGRAWVNGLALDHGAFSGPRAQKLAAVARRLDRESLFWFRTCATFGAERGHLFARAWSRGLGCRVAGHSHNIGFFHGGLHGLRAGHDPDWSVDEGLAKGTPASPVEMTMSGPWWRQANTITCLDSKFPDSW